jgi:hypothetical protein
MAPLLRKSTYQVIHDLPDSATEWQKDSAVQAYFQPGQNIRYSDRPDTLGLPGQRYEAPPGTLCADSLGYPKAYLDSFAWSRQGKAHAAKAADPVPYRTGADNLVASMLVVGCLVAILALARSMRFVMKMCKNMFFTENERTTTVPDTAAELRGQGWLVLFTSLLLAVTYYSYALSAAKGVTFMPRHGLLFVYIAAVIGYFLFKTAIYQFVNWVFFDKKKIEQWNKSLLFLTAMEGIAATPAVLLFIFGNLSLSACLIIVVIVAILTKLCTFYKCYLIFFQRFGAFLQIFLYFCALELIPMVGLVELLETLNNNLKINF